MYEIEFFLEFNPFERVVLLVHTTDTTLRIIS